MNTFKHIIQYTYYIPNELINEYNNLLKFMLHSNIYMTRGYNCKKYIIENKMKMSI